MMLKRNTSALDNLEYFHNFILKLKEVVRIPLYEENYYKLSYSFLSYSPIRLLEVCVPLPKIYIKRQAPLKVTILQDLKDFSQK